MFRVVTGLGMALVAGVAIAGSAAAGDATTTRIEPRGFYGATVTIESGVRVFRPLPRTTRVIINPNKTPLNLSFKETRHVYEGHHHSNAGSHNGNEAAPHHGGSGVAGFPLHGFKHRGKRSRRAAARSGF